MCKQIQKRIKFRQCCLVLIYKLSQVFQRLLSLVLFMGRNSRLCSIHSGRDRTNLISRRKGNHEVLAVVTCSMHDSRSG